jgi:uncharacterized damage-inducible protein DinB
MVQKANLLDETLDAWGFSRDGCVSEFRNIPATEFGYRASPHSRTVAELAQHIIESGLMAAGELSRTDGDFQRQDYMGFIREYAGTRAHTGEKDALVALLEATHGENIARLQAAGEAAMLRSIVQFNGEPATRLTWLNHAIAHEEYHRGQIALYARLLGHVPALTQAIRGGA